MDFENVVKSRRSVRRFTEKKIPASVVRKIVEDATYAPTPCNQQLWKFIAVTDDRIKKKLIVNAYSSTIIRRAPVVLVACYDSWSTKEAIQASAMAVQNLLLSATANGVGSLAMNSYGNEKKIKRILKIPENYLINCFVLLGYPTEVYDHTPAVSRRPVNEVLSFNKFESRFSATRSYDSEDWNNGLAVKAGLFKVSSDVMTTGKYVAIRVFQYVFGRFSFINKHVKKVLRDMLISKKSKPKMFVLRKFSFEKGIITIEDSFKSLFSDSEVLFSQKFSEIYVPSSQYFQLQELSNSPLAVKMGAKNRGKIVRVINANGDVNLK